MPRKLVLIGPESTGKTTLSIYLAKLYNFDLITEYSRIYLSKKVTLTAGEDLKKLLFNKIKLYITVLKKLLWILNLTIKAAGVISSMVHAILKLKNNIKL